MTTAKVCAKDYVKTTTAVRAVAATDVFRAYGLDAKTAKASYKIDRLIPVSLGGNGTIQNVWPQPDAAVNGFKAKNDLEVHLRKLVCSGTITLDAATSALSADWYAAKVTYGTMAVKKKKKR